MTSTNKPWSRYFVSALLILCAVLAIPFWSTMLTLKCPSHGRIFLINGETGKPMPKTTHIQYFRWYEGASLLPIPIPSCKETAVDGKGSFAWRDDKFTVYFSGEAIPGVGGSAATYTLPQDGERVSPGIWKVTVWPKHNYKYQLSDKKTGKPLANTEVQVELASWDMNHKAVHSAFKWNLISSSDGIIIFPRPVSQHVLDEKGVYQIQPNIDEAVFKIEGYKTLYQVLPSQNPALIFEPNP